MAKTVTLRLDDEVYDLFVEAAKAEKRSLSNLIETAALSRNKRDDGEKLTLAGGTLLRCCMTSETLDGNQ